MTYLALITICFIISLFTHILSAKIILGVIAGLMWFANLMYIYGKL